jgi:uncharacterized protein YqcC (DUF446 family)
MGKLVTTYQHIADILSFQNSDPELSHTLSNPKFDWDALVIEGSKHLVLPTIYCRLKQKQLLHHLPVDLNTYLQELTKINRNRNKRILAQVKDISKLLKSYNINHIFLKGTALLFSNCYTDIGERMVGDIDILVQNDQIIQAFEILNKNGYNKTFGFAYVRKDFRHLDRLIKKNELAAIELHKQLLNVDTINSLKTPNIFNSIIFLNDIAITNKKELMHHLILAWQLNDHGHFYKQLNFKTLYDVIVLGFKNDKGTRIKLLDVKEVDSFFALGKLYFEEFEHIQLKAGMHWYVLNHKWLINYPFFSIVVKGLKYSYLNIKERLFLILNSGNYRKHLIKKIFYKKN